MTDKQADEQTDRHRCVRCPYSVRVGHLMKFQCCINQQWTPARDTEQMSINGSFMKRSPAAMDCDKGGEPSALMTVIWGRVAIGWGRH